MPRKKGRQRSISSRHNRKTRPCFDSSSGMPQRRSISVNSTPRSRQSWRNSGKTCLMRYSRSACKSWKVDDRNTRRAVWEVISDTDYPPSEKRDSGSSTLARAEVAHERGVVADLVAELLEH